MIGLVSQVAEKVGISSQACRRIASSAYLRYKKFVIPKSNGRDFRFVAQPAKEVKAIQRALVEILGAYLPVHDSATAYRIGLSICDNARRHASAKFITKLDFSDFFPSIDAPALSAHLRAHIANISDAEVMFIMNACLWRPEGRQVLCIGAPSSPMLSNSVMFEFDTLISGLASQADVVYTRYSDDITVSSREPDKLRGIEIAIRKACATMSHPKLEINEKKRVAVGRGNAMRVTGLTLTNAADVSVGRLRKRGVRAGINRYVNGDLDDDQVERLKGELAFVLSVEPNFAEALLRSYGAMSLSKILPRKVLP
ncbi:retron St85 family RNA-directed DNA polymerase [Lysobacter gummosus]|uniref:RNA-directed DNA polymerase n=1 Tax=Lysobacter gummosus TaxID=262324 RepID=A0ABY3X789_9GAMM|nr:retron St85 family RNA-directed DNA polymerase [Lysobacter gummosus]UNP28454.1 retron St85 family RNA-directed DNA polymerase [Lysobacter gummosus]